MRLWRFVITFTWNLNPNGKFIQPVLSTCELKKFNLHLKKIIRCIWMDEIEAFLFLLLKLAHHVPLICIWSFYVEIFSIWYELASKGHTNINFVCASFSGEIFQLNVVWHILKEYLYHYKMNHAVNHVLNFQIRLNNSNLFILTWHPWEKVFKRCLASSSSFLATWVI